MAYVIFKMIIFYKKLFTDFTICHHGTVNKLLHMVGLLFIAVGLIKINITYFIIGALIQECGHFYQYFKTKEQQYSPKFCFKPQIFIVYPLFILGATYILLN